MAEALARAVAASLPGHSRTTTDLPTAVFGADPTPAATPVAQVPHHFPARAGVIAPGSSVSASSSTRLTATLLSSTARARAVADRSASAGAAVLEIGAGTGYYLAAVLDAVPAVRGIALDVSKAAARRAARAHSRAGSVLADAWRGLPVRDAAVDAVVCVFAPRNAEEVARVLTPGGRFVVVTPTSRHLAELIGPLDMVSVDEAKEDRLAESLGGRFDLVARERVEYAMGLSRADVANVVAMGPSAFHDAERRAERIAGLPDSMPVTASVSVATYRVR
ncbi:methyltransferase domain-containing protein [Nocardia sp. ET3-3]|uniref:Methyltransferase domain-containing protein n=1 Tax=Nocardia terrae TaxID=2675851 RepID=A0A7K1V5Z5_9NOCA|nr:methyltransferase domain-containing protein [Nocardia terrae]